MHSIFFKGNLREGELNRVTINLNMILWFHFTNRYQLDYLHILDVIIKIHRKNKWIIKKTYFQMIPI